MGRISTLKLFIFSAFFITLSNAQQQQLNSGSAQQQPHQQQQQQQNIVRSFGSLFGAANSLDPCSYFTNITDVQQLNHHEFVAFEQCLYYYLAQRAQHQASGAFGTLHPIATLPPVAPYTGVQRQEGTNDDIRVRIGQITLQHFQLNEFLKDLHIVGYFEMQWDDPRLSWDYSQWKVDHLQIHSANHVWMPVLSSQGYETALRNDDAMEMRRIETTNQGNVSAIVSFSLKTFCDDSDFRHFPDDIYKCCFLLEPHYNQELIEFVVDGLPVFTDSKYFKDYGWFMSGTIPNVNSDPNVIAQLNFCINLQRASSAVKIELAVPTWASAILLLFSPLFGSVRSQLYLKLFLLFIQLITLSLFSNRVAPHLGSASATPVLMAVHELAIVLNVISIVFSIVISTFARIRRNLPPWAWLSRTTQIINKFLVFNAVSPNSNSAPAMIDHYCYYDSSGVTDTNDQFEVEKGSCMINGISKVGNGGSAVATASKSSSNKIDNDNGRYQAEWNSAFLAIHTLGVTAISIVFIFSYLLIR